MMDYTTAGDLPASNSHSSDSAADEYTRIGEMARTFGVTLRALRFYEDKGLLDPRREGSTRLYTRRDRTRLKLILLGRRIGFSLREVKQIIDLYVSGGPNTRQYKVLIDKGERQRVRLDKQRRQIEQAIGELDDLLGDVRARMGDRQASAHN